MIFDQLKEIVTSAIGSIDVLIGHVRSERASDDQYFVSFFNSMNGPEDAHDDDTSVPLDSHLFDGAALNPTSSYSYREDASLPILNQSRCRIIDRVIDTSGLRRGEGVCMGRNNNEGKQRWVSWDNDEALKGSVMAIKDAAKALSNDYLKLALLVATASSQESLTGLVEELCSCTKAFIHSYFTFLECSYSDCLFDSVTRLVRGVLHHLQELIDTIQSAAATAPYVNSNALVCDRHSLDKINYLTGMVLGVKADIDKLPVDNRQSYRKFLLEQCLSINETYKEFRGYVDEARRKCDADEEVDRGDASSPEDSTEQSSHSSSNGTKKNEKYSEKEDKDEYDDDDGNNNDADDSDDEYEEELDYTELEVRMVDLCVLLIARCVEVVKQSIAVVTVVNDALSRSSTHDTPLITVFQTHSLSDNPSINIDPSFSMWEYSSRWVAHVASLSTELNTKVLDLGAELYPPFADDLQQIQTLAQALSVEVTRYIRKTVAVEPLGDKIDANVKPMLIKMQQLLIEVSSCEQDISKLC